MQNLKSPLLRILSGVLALTSFTCAAQAESYSLTGVDITPVVKMFEPEVKTFVRPTVMYNWSSGGNQSFWDTPRASDDPSFLRTVESMATVYWDRYGDNSAGNMYGFGLYGAVDPVTTFSFGGGNSGDKPGWLLLELRLPIGFRIVSTGYYGVQGAAPSADVADVLAKFECPALVTVDTFLSNGGSALTANCRTLGKKIFSDILKIDGFAYAYSATRFESCEGDGWQGQRAFVITNPRFLKQEDIRFFNARSSYETEMRQRIQTLFLLTSGDRSDPKAPALDSLRAYLKAHADTFVAGSMNRCEGTTCIITVKFCTDKGSCEDVPLAPIARPGGDLITNAEAEKTVAAGLLWKDLEGVSKSVTVKGWLKANRYACSGQLPYDETTNGGAK